MFLPPVCMAAVLSANERASEKAVTSFRQVWDDYEQLKQVERPSTTVKLYLKRHPCQQLACLQLKHGFDDGGWRRDNEKVFQELHNRFGCLMASVVVEDINNVQKNFKKQTGWGGRYRRPETSMYAAVASEVVSKSHRFGPLEIGSCEQPENFLDESDFVAKGKCSIPCDSISSTTATAPYFSPTAENTGIAWADAAVIRLCVAVGDFELPSACWQGF